MTPGTLHLHLATLLGWLACHPLAEASPDWLKDVGMPGPGGWKCHVIQADPEDHGPDGINFHDWDGDGDVDVFVNYEEGRFSRLFFNPGKASTRKPWQDFIELKHGKCEDSGIGDLDDDGDIDYVANGGWIYFNPGRDRIKEADEWVKMTLFDREQRVPIVMDVDGDGLNDLVVGGQRWFRQPKTAKHVAEHWTKHDIGKAGWPMNCHPHDVDHDGLVDLVVADRRKEIFWLRNPGEGKHHLAWRREKLHPHTSMFTAIGDVDHNGIDDLLIAGGQEGQNPWKKHLTILLRTNRQGTPEFHEIRIPQPCGNFPKGVALLNLDADPETRELVVVPKQGDLWTARFSGDPSEAGNWQAVPIVTPGASTRKKMDNAYIADIDGDGDEDIATTEENGGWGVIWFENPLKP